ncbi:MAG: alpha-glucan family phosphorylase, partial [Planctomycetota bacterium]
MAKSKTSRRTATKPAELSERVRALAYDLSWTWNHDTQRVFAALDPAMWDATNHDPLRVIAQTPPERWDALNDEPRFVRLLERCEAATRRTERERRWFQRAFRGRDARLCVAYFCSEFALHESLPQYSGGLGVLAGDHLKAASDLGVPLVGVGLLYRCGYYQQQFAPDGSQRAIYPHYDFEQMPIRDTGASVAVPVGGRSVECKIWSANVGRTRLLLLDADHRGNRPSDRALTHALYAGDPEHRLRQQVLLGVGGYAALSELGIRATVYHLNEGHAAFCGLARLSEQRRRGRSMAKAIENVRRASVFTTHTPVPAGHDRYEPRLIVKHLRPLMESAGIDRTALLALGRENPDDRREWFCMTVLALRLSAHCNGVAELHGDTSRRMWQHLYPQAKTPDDVPIGHVTNGVHPQTWIAPEALP